MVEALYYVEHDRSHFYGLFYLEAFHSAILTDNPIQHFTCLVCAIGVYFNHGHNRDPIFTRRIQAILADDEYRLLQAQLVQKPDAGKIIPGSGGLRKLRWSASGRGKRGGARVIYYWLVFPEVILMLFAYPKNERDDLTPDQLKQLKKIVEGELK